MKVLVLAFICAAGLYGQSCAITSPATGTLYTSPQTIPLTISVSSAPTAHHATYLISYRRWATAYNVDQGQSPSELWENWQGSPFEALWYTGLNGDGLHFAQAFLYDIYGTQLAQCTSSLFTVRIEGMSTQAIFPAVPTSGTGSAGLLTFDGTNAQSSGNGTFSVDGYPLGQTCGGAGLTSQTGGWATSSFTSLGTSTCFGFPNGSHLITMAYDTRDIADPYLLSSGVSSISGSTITTTTPSGIPGHYSTTGSIVTFSNVGGSLPTGLTAGSQCSKESSVTSTCTATLSIAAGVATVALSVSSGATTGTPVYLRNIRSTDQTTGIPNCDGYYTANAGTTGTSILVTVPSFCNSITASNEFEVSVNPYFATFIDSNHLSVSATCSPCTGNLANPIQPGATQISPTGGSGTTSILQRVRSAYWGGNSDFAHQGGVAVVQELVTFSNGTSPMRLMPKFWEMHLIAGASATSNCDSTKFVQNADNSFSTLACNASGVTWAEIDDGGKSGVCSVDGSGNVTPISAGWCKVTAACAACATGSVSLQTYTTYVQVCTTACTFPTYTSTGPLATSFTPGSSHRFNSVWQSGLLFSTGFRADANARGTWLGPLFNGSGVNAAQYGLTTNTQLNDPTGTTCPFLGTLSSTIPQMYWSEQFASQWGISLEFDMQTVVWYAAGSGNDLRSLGAILNNTGYNRKSCVQSMASHFVSSGNYVRTHLDDESTDEYGSINRPPPLIGGGDWTDATVSGSSIIFHFNPGISIQTAWSQSTGLGAWLQIVSATNTCLNSWYPMNTVTNGGPGTSYTLSITSVNVNSCPNGTYEPSGGVTEATAQFVLSPTYITSVQNLSALPNALGVIQTCWSGAGGCSTSGQILTSIVVSGSTATIHWTGHGLPSSNTPAIRISGATTANLNILAQATYVDANTLTISYQGGTGMVAPAASTYNLASDSGLFITVDPNWGPNALGQFYTLFDGVTNAPTDSFSILGALNIVGSNTSPTVQSFEGPPIATNSFNYFPNPPAPIYGSDASVYGWMTNTFGSSGILTRPFQSYPRSFLWGAGYNFIHYCQSQIFNPGCDHPVIIDSTGSLAGLYWRPETLISQRYSMKSLGGSMDRLYNFDNNAGVDYTNCCGWNPATGGQPFSSMNQNTNPNQWNAYTLLNSLMAQDERWELQPEGNKPNVSPLILSDVHLSATYGNQLSLLCGAEQPQGSLTVNTNAISGGTLVLKTLDGYKETVAFVGGNPSTLTREFCPSPGFITDIIAEPPGANVVETKTFSPPPALPFGASKYLVRVSYSPYEPNRADAIDCTSGCSLAIDHHSNPVNFQSLYANSSSVVVGPQNPTPSVILSMGLP